MESGPHQPPHGPVGGSRSYIRAPTVVVSEQSMDGHSTTEHKALIRDYFAAWDGGDPEVIASFFADDFSTTYTNWAGEEIQITPDEVTDWIAGWLDVVAEMTHEIHRVVSEDDTVFAHITYRGVHDGEISGIAPTGNRIEVEEYLRFRIEDGEIVDFDWLSDDLSLIRQLGVDLPITQ